MTEEEFKNLSVEEFLKLWDDFSVTTEIKTENNTPVGFREYILSKYGLDISKII